MQALAAGLTAILDDLGQTAAERLAHSLPVYAARLERAGEDLVQLARAGVAREVSALATIGTPLARRTLTGAAETGRLRAWEGFELEGMVEELTIYRDVVVAGLERASAGHQGAVEALVLAERRLDALREELVLGLTRGYVEGRSAMFEREHRELEALIGIGRAVNRSLEVAEVAEAGLGETVSAMRLDAGALWLLEDGGVSLAATYGFGRAEREELEERPRPAGELIAQAIGSEEPVDARLAFGASLPERALMATALRFKGRPLGVMAVGDGRVREYNRREREFLKLVGEHVAVALDHAYEHRREARTDFLTGLANRSEFERAVEREVAAARRHRRPFSLLVIDLDFLKKINDTHGHLAGDQAIRAVAEALRASLRASDTCARLGGDEFAAAMPDADGRQAQDVAQRVVGALDALNRGRRFPYRISVSTGMATWEEGMEPLELLRLADQFLYRDKRRRRRGTIMRKMVRR